MIALHMKKMMISQIVDKLSLFLNCVKVIVGTTCAPSEKCFPGKLFATVSNGFDICSVMDFFERR